MNLSLSLVLCCLPVVIFFVLFRGFVRGFRCGSGLWAVTVGLLSLLPITVAQQLVRDLPLFMGGGLLAVFITALLFNGLVEEGVKMLCMFLLPIKNASAETFFARCLLCGLSLGSFEAMIYLFAGYHQVVLRLVTAVAIHTLCAGLSGCFLWSIRRRTKKTAGKGTAVLPLPLVLSVTLHGAYNFFAGFTGVFWWFSVVALLLAAVECRVWFQRIQQG